MIRKKPRIYIDSCCFINVIKGYFGIGIQSSNDTWHTKAILEACKNGDLEIFTSTLTIAECLYIDESPKNLTDEQKRLISSILTSGKICKLIQTSLDVCENTRNICWDHGIAYKGADGIHLASAVKVECGEFFSNDRLIEKEGVKKLYKEQFGVKLIYPHQTSFLPSRYRQKNLPLVSKKKAD